MAFHRKMKSFSHSIASYKIFHSTYGWKLKIALNWNLESDSDQTIQICNFILNFLFYISKQQRKKSKLFSFIYF